MNLYQKSKGALGGILVIADFAGLEGGSPFGHSGSTPLLQLEWSPSAGLRIFNLVPCRVITRRRTLKIYFRFFFKMG